MSGAEPLKSYFVLVVVVLTGSSDDSLVDVLAFSFVSASSLVLEHEDIANSKPKAVIIEMICLFVFISYSFPIDHLIELFAFHALNSTPRTIILGFAYSLVCTNLGKIFRALL